MKIKSYLIVFIFTQSCNNQEVRPELVFNASAWKKEFIDPHQLKILDSFPFYNPIDSLNRLAPIINKFEYFGTQKLFLLKAGELAGSVFAVEDSVLYPVFIDLQSTNIFLTYGALKLDNNTGVNEIMRRFPNSSLHSGCQGEYWSGHIQIASINQDWQTNVFFLVFEKGKLSKILYKRVFGG